jgi:hypothetical protein
MSATVANGLARRGPTLRNAAPRLPRNERAVRCEFPIPEFPPLARQARLSGTLTVVVSLAQDAKVKEISAQSHLNNDRAQAILLTPVEKAIRKSDFAPSCGGKDVTFTFEFRINGDPYCHQRQEVTFGYPNHFSITIRPPIPTNSQ